jgi:hypothetical protein
MEKNTCPHCGAWGQLSKFCHRCGNSIIYSSIKQGQAEFEGKKITPSTQRVEMPIIIILGFLLTLSVAVLITAFQ